MNKILKTLGYLIALPFMVILFGLRLWRINVKAKNYSVDPTLYTTEERYFFVYRFVKLALRIKRISIASSGFKKASGAPSLYIANHKSAIDPLVIFKLMYEARQTPYFRFVSKIENKKHIFRNVFTLVDTVYIDRSNVREILKTYNEINIAKDRRSIILFIEGTRVYDLNQLGNFMPGSLQIAYRNNVAITPLVMYGTVGLSKSDKTEYKNINKQIFVACLAPFKPVDFITIQTIQFADTLKELMTKEYLRIKKIVNNQFTNPNKVFDEVDKFNKDERK
ncbi:MAG: 1-acyl-sn-glycerol-3-phosphate acyltransferase [Mycoplasma sp.]